MENNVLKKLFKAAWIVLLLACCQLAIAAPTVSVSATPSNPVAPATVTLAVTASSDGDPVMATQVEYFNGSTSLGASVQPPFTLTLDNLAAGTYQISAKVTTTDPANPVLQSAPLPVTVGTPPGAAIAYFIHTDQLNTPRAITDVGGNLVWQWDSDPFGKDAPNEQPAGQPAFAFNQRFPGQQFDRESNLNYNFHRDYDPALGRYVESDPIGLQGGINTYGYVQGNPTGRADPLGLCGPLMPLCIFVAEYGIELAVGVEMAAVIATNTPGPVTGTTTFAGRVATEAIHDVYVGYRAGKPVYVGITNDLARRTCEHGARFDAFEKITSVPLTRDQARAIEQAIMNQNPQFENVKNSIAPTRSWYEEAVQWAHSVLGNKGRVN